MTRDSNACGVGMTSGRFRRAGQMLKRVRATGLLSTGATVFAFCVIYTLGGGIQAMAQGAASGAIQQSQTRNFSIEAQELSLALNRFSEQADISFAYKTGELSGLRSSEVAGTLTLEAALQRLLAGTGVTFQFTDASTVTLQRSASQDQSGRMRLGPITVEAVLPGTLTTSYNAPRFLCSDKDRYARDRYAPVCPIGDPPTTRGCRGE